MGRRLLTRLHEVRSRLAGSLNHRVLRHLGSDHPESITRAYPGYLARDVAVALWRFLGGLGAEVMRFNANPTELLTHDKLHPDRAGSPPVLEQLERILGFRAGAPAAEGA